MLFNWRGTQSRLFFGDQTVIKCSKYVALLVTVILAVVGTASAQEELRVGLVDAEPGIIRSNNQLGGRDIEIWDAIGKDVGLRITYVFVSNPTALLAALDEGKVDVAGWAVSRTPTTETKYLLTDTIFPSAEALVVPKTDTRMYRGLDDLKGLSFATLKASDYFVYLNKNGITNVKEFNSIPDVLKAVTSGEVNAAMFSGIIAGYMNKQGKLGNLQVVSSYQPALARPIMAAFPKTATETYAKVNASLQKLHADGTMAKIKAKYGL
jgi:polar amino acid transport system substrate-binding protein